MYCRWWNEQTVAVVTGGNKGIGLGMVKRLAELGLTVVLTSRDAVKGMEAVQSLTAELGLAAAHRRRCLHFFQLDVSDPASIQHFVSAFHTKFSALHLLVSCIFLVLSFILTWWFLFIKIKMNSMISMSSLGGTLIILLPSKNNKIFVFFSI